MKKPIIIYPLLVLVLILSTTGCSSPGGRAFFQGLGGAMNGGYNQYQINNLNSQQIQNNFNNNYH
jgi:hypothetical protein